MFYIQGLPPSKEEEREEARSVWQLILSQKEKNKKNKEKAKKSAETKAKKKK